MCSGSEAGSYLRLIDFVYHSTLGLRVIKKKKRQARTAPVSRAVDELPGLVTCFRDLSVQHGALRWVAALVQHVELRS